MTHAKNVFNYVVKFQRSRITIEWMRSFAITYVLEILIFALRPHIREIVEMSLNKIEILDLFKVSVFIKYIFY